MGPYVEKRAVLTVHLRTHVQSPAGDLLISRYAIMLIHAYTIFSETSFSVRMPPETFVAHTGFEPAISSLRGRRHNQLDQWAKHGILPFDYLLIDRFSF